MKSMKFIDRSKKNPNELSRLSILLPTFFCLVCGILLLVLQSLALRITAWVLAATLLGFGIWSLVRYFRSDAMTRITESSMAFGLILITAAVLLAFNPDYLKEFLPFIWGLSMFFGAFLKVQYAFDVKTVNVEKWWIMLIFAAFSLIFGILSLIRPEFFGDKVETVIGIFLIVEGVLDIVVFILLNKAIKKLFPSESPDAAPAAQPAVQASPAAPAAQPAVQTSPAAPVAQPAVQAPPAPPAAPAAPADPAPANPAPEAPPAPEK